MQVVCVAPHPAAVRAEKKRAGISPGLHLNFVARGTIVADFFIRYPIILPNPITALCALIRARLTAVPLTIRIISHHFSVQPRSDIRLQHPFFVHFGSLPSYINNISLYVYNVNKIDKVFSLSNQQTTRKAGVAPSMTACHEAQKEPGFLPASAYSP
jgi:hypothetical protein